MRLDKRAEHLGSEFERTYQVHYPQLSWHVHSGVTGLGTLTAESFAHLCGLDYVILISCYVAILETIVDAFGITKADDKLKNRIDFARVIAFGGSDEEVFRDFGCG